MQEGNLRPALLHTRSWQRSQGPPSVPSEASSTPTALSGTLEKGESGSTSEPHTPAGAEVAGRPWAPTRKVLPKSLTFPVQRQLRVSEDRSWHVWMENGSTWGRAARSSFFEPTEDPAAAGAKRAQEAKVSSYHLITLSLSFHLDFAVPHVAIQDLQQAGTSYPC